MPRIELAWCCDNKYARHMGVAICSVLHNLSPDTQASIYIAHTGLGRQNRSRLAAVFDRYHAHVHFIEVDPRRFEGLKISHYITPAAYIRIALPELLPKTVSKVLYLDCDLIVREDITPLATADIGSSPLGAIPESDQSSWCMNGLKHIMGIPHDAAYFNSGVLLMNLDKWRSERISDKLLQFIRGNPHRIRWWDQDAMNIFFHDSYTRLGYRWNLTPKSLEVFASCLNAPIGIVHFVTGVKPWHAGCEHPLKAEYFKYLAMTPWSSCGPPLRSARRAWGDMALEAAHKIYRKALSLYRARRAIRSRTVLCKEEVAALSGRFARTSILVNAGIKKITREHMLGYTVRFFSYEGFVALFNEVFIDSDYFFETASTKPLIIDCSSGIGMTVLYFKRLYPYSSIIAFEPDGGLFGLLEENVRANRLEDVQVRNSAAAGRDGDLELYGNETPGGADATAGQNRTHVCGERLSAFIDGPVAFIKLDRAGTEHGVIEDLAHSGKLRLVKKIVIKHHPNVPGRAKGLAGILETLERHGFDYQLRSECTGFSAGTRNFQTVMIFAYNKNTD